MLSNKTQSSFGTPFSLSRSVFLPVPWRHTSPTSCHHLKCKCPVKRKIKWAEGRSYVPSVFVQHVCPGNGQSPVFQGLQLGLLCLLFGLLLCPLLFQDFLNGHLL
uniref:Uncharacterized protein n=1 Tax=Anguilla anguilla TaxID=7936 RepID=A0A0E9XD82_ANGAN